MAARAGAPRWHSVARPACARLSGLAFALVILAGCNAGVRWQVGRYDEALKRGQREGRLTFVYFRNWYAAECTDFEEHMLKDPEVLAETNTMVCVPLDFDWDQPLAVRWTLKKAPAFAIVTPDGEVLARRQTPLVRDDVLKEMRAAKSAFAARERERALRPAREAAGPATRSSGTSP